MYIILFQLIASCVAVTTRCDHTFPISRGGLVHYGHVHYNNSRILMAMSGTYKAHCLNQAHMHHVLSVCLSVCLDLPIYSDWAPYNLHHDLFVRLTTL